MNVLTCRKCSKQYQVGSVILNENTKYCPQCRCSTIKVRAFDEYDLLSIETGLTRSVLYGIDCVRAGHFSHLTLQEYMFMTLSLKHDQPYYPITVSCKTCAASFRFHNMLPTEQTPPKHCAYCGAQTITVLQDPDLQAWEVLANHYNMSIELVKFFYKAFTQQNSRTRFDDYIILLKQQMNA